jgi:nitroimidazol reductase NimA-like FMN-containing flavoprotein (pyridoxamine 5'-phosphate oxidase superfamily)
MKEKAIRILEQHRLMAIATNRPDGWPQATMVGYANEDVLIYFVISRQSQKFANIEQDDRVSIVVGGDFHDPSEIKALSIAAHADEIRDEGHRNHALNLVLERHPELEMLEAPGAGHSAIMRANPAIITILDYSKGFGHADVLTVGAGGLTDMTPARDDDWGFGGRLKPVA